MPSSASTAGPRRSSAPANSASSHRRPGFDQPPPLSVSDGLELLERLPAALAVADRAARRRPEDVLEARLVRAAVRAAERLRLQLDEARRRSLARCRWRKARGTELLPAR